MSLEMFGLHSRPRPGEVRRHLLERCSAAAEWVGSLCTPRGRAAFGGKNYNQFIKIKGSGL